MNLRNLWTKRLFRFSIRQVSALAYSRALCGFASWREPGYSYPGGEGTRCLPPIMAIL